MLRPVERTGQAGRPGALARRCGRSAYKNNHSLSWGGTVAKETPHSSLCARRVALFAVRLNSCCSHCDLNRAVTTSYPPASVQLLPSNWKSHLDRAHLSTGAVSSYLATPSNLSLVASPLESCRPDQSKICPDDAGGYADMQSSQGAAGCTQPTASQQRQRSRSSNHPRLVS